MTGQLTRQHFRRQREAFARPASGLGISEQEVTFAFYVSAMGRVVLGSKQFSRTLLLFYFFVDNFLNIFY